MARGSSLSTLPEAEHFTKGAPPGPWVRNINSLRPITPLYGDFKVARHLPTAMNAAREEFSLLEPPRKSVIVDGYVFGGYVGPFEPSAERIQEFEEKVRRRHDLDVISRWPSLKRSIGKQLSRLQSVVLSELSDEELLRHLGKLDDGISDWYSIHFRNNRAGPLVIGRCALFCYEHAGLDTSQYLSMLTGYSGASREPDRVMGRIATSAMRRPGITSTVEAEDAWRFAEVQELLSPYVRRFGHRCLEFEYIHPTLAEQPERLVALLREAIARASIRQSPLPQEQTAEESVRASLNGTDKPVFDQLLAEARMAYGVREDDIGFCLWGEGLMRYAFLELGRRLVERQALERAEEVFFLRRSEVAEAFHSARKLRRSAVGREEDYRRQHEIDLPPSFGEPPAESRWPLSPEAQDALRAMRWTTILPQPPVTTGERIEVLRGQAASKGVYVGKARIVRSEEEFEKVNPGDVLVCPTTSPSWSVLFGIVGALVTDGGSILSHPAIVAREFGIPAVVATQTATSKLQDGQLVTVDGTGGVVRLP